MLNYYYERKMIAELVSDFFVVLDFIENHLWGYVGFPLLILLGIYFSYKSNFVQIRHFHIVVKNFFELLRPSAPKNKGVHPISAFFACVGGCIGIGNIVAICIAVQLGGPGALLWVWIAAMFGTLLKYSEVYLGVRYRIPNQKGGYDGGPMYYLQKAFRGRWIPNIIAFLLCIYGVEILQFSVITHSMTTNLGVNQYLVIAVLLGLVIFAGKGGVRRVGKISSAIIPFFLLCYLAMGAWVVFQHIDRVPEVFGTIISSAFTGHAAMGAFAGSTMMLGISQGVRRACYSGDVGVGYASIIHSETSSTVPEKQASLVIFDIFLDAFICTTSVFLVLLTDIWHQPLNPEFLVQSALDQFFPYMHVFMPIFLFLLGYSTIIAYFCAGIKSAEFLYGEKGRRWYYVYATVALLLFSFIDTTQAAIVMSIILALLLIINLTGIFKLRDHIVFDFKSASAPTAIPAPPKAVANMIPENNL